LIGAIAFLIMLFRYGLEEILKQVLSVLFTGLFMSFIIIKLKKKFTKS